MRIFLLSLLFSCLCLGSALADSPLTSPMQDGGIVLLTITGEGVRVRRNTAIEADPWYTIGSFPAGTMVLAEQWPVRNWQNDHLWYKLVAVVEAPSLRVVPIFQAISADWFSPLPFISDRFVTVTPWAECGFDKKDVLAQLARTPYGQGYAAIDNSREGQKKLVEGKSLANWLAIGDSKKTIPMYKGPSEDSGLVEDFLLSSHAIANVGMQAVDTSVPGWVRMESIYGMAPSGWARQELAMGEYNEAKCAGRQFIFNIGANVPDIIRRWGPLEAINESDGEQHGYTEMAFDGMNVKYQDHRNMKAELTRKGAGIGGIFIGVAGYDKAYVKSIYGEIIEEESGLWGKSFKVAGHWDGWWYSAALEFDAKGLVSKIDFTCQDIDLSH